MIYSHYQPVPGCSTLTFIHGFPFDSSQWDPQIAHLKGRIGTLTYDQRGHGKSPVGDGQYPFEGFVDDLFSVLDGHRIEKTIVCGLSMGGYVALRAIEREPQRFSGLILADTRSEADSDAAKLKRYENIKTIKNKSVSEFSESFIQSVLSPETRQKQPETVQKVRGMITGNTVAGIIGTLLALAGRTDTTQSLSAIRIPTHIIVGEKDTVTPVSAAESLHRAIPDSQMTVLRDAGHLSNLERASDFNATLDSFLAIRMNYH